MPKHISDAIQPEDVTLEDFYNVLMELREPELCTYTIADLDAMYAKESTEHRTERYAYYAHVFEEVWTMMLGYMQLAKAELIAFKETMLLQIKRTSSESEGDTLGTIEDSISAA